MPTVTARTVRAQGCAAADGAPMATVWKVCAMSAPNASATQMQAIVARDLRTRG